MEAPMERMSLEDFTKTIAAHVFQNYEETAGGYMCKNCEAEIRETTCFVSLHAAEFGEVCVKAGEVKQYPLPYCPTCEGVPKNTNTCVRISVKAALLKVAPLEVN